MSERKNAGYTITDSIHVGNAEFVIGEHPKAPCRYVTWECSGGSNYFWGHYFPDRRSAEKNLLDRAQTKLVFVMQQEEQSGESTKDSVYKGREPICLSYDARKLSYDGFELFDREVLFTQARVDRDTLPKGIFAYDLRHGDDDGIPCVLEKYVVVNHFGTVLSNRPFFLPREGYKPVGEDDYSFSGQPECTLADYMKTHPPKHKETER